jgi:hypothetical protein
MGNSISIDPELGPFPYKQSNGEPVPQSEVNSGLDSEIDLLV